MPSILCVDDEEIPLFLRKRVLEKSGYEVVAVPSGTEALEKLRTRHFDLVLSDQVMPDLTGTQLAKAIKETYPGTPVALISGVNEVPQDIACVDAFISKLEGPDVLSQKIAELLGIAVPNRAFPGSIAG